MPNTPNAPIYIVYKGKMVAWLTNLQGGLSMRERDVENYLREKVKKAGGIAYKFESPGNAGVPDRLVLFPNGKIHFVELKAPGKKPTNIQLAQHRKFNKMGFEVLVIDSKEGVDKFIAKVGLK